MSWRFTILDRNNVATVIDEPTGWDANKSQIKRDLEWHGVFFTTSGETFQFDGIAMKLLNNEYLNYGIEGNMILILEEDFGNGYEEFCRGKFMFKNYELVTSDECYVKIPIETSTEVKDIRTKINQKVNIDSLIAFNQTTALNSYKFLPTEFELHGKAVLLKNRAEVKDTSVEKFNGGLDGSLNAGAYRYDMQLEFGLPDNSLNEFLGFNVNGNHLTNQVYGGFNHPTGNSYVPNNKLNPLNCSPILNYTNEFQNYLFVSNPVTFDIRLKGLLEVKRTNIYEAFIYVLKLKAGRNGDYADDYDFLTSYKVVDDATYTGTKIDVQFDFIYQDDLTLKKGDRIYLLMAFREEKSPTCHSDVSNGIIEAFKLTLTNESHILITDKSNGYSSITKAYMANETISRVVESITDKKLLAYSELFGRVDSQPYSIQQDGKAGLLAFTDGIRIRKKERNSNGNPINFSLSLQDLFDGLNPIYNIGMGIEPDVNRSGFNRLRVENWKHFYQNNIIFECRGINKITRTVNEKEIYSTFSCGYEKWESEWYNGLDEFFSKRTFRTTFSAVKNDLIKLSKFIASGYAIEATKRKINDASDWKYDNDTFIICAAYYDVTTQKTAVVDYMANNIVQFQIIDPLIQVGSVLILTSTTGQPQNDGTYHVASLYYYAGTTIITVTENTFIVDMDEVNYSVDGNGGTIERRFKSEQGGVQNASDVYEDGSIYNWRISPFRNALRWVSKIFSSYRKFDNGSRLIFTDGTGNYNAASQLINGGDENTTVKENQNIDKNIFSDENDAKPLLSPERVVFEYPINSRDYKNLEKNCYGLIFFSNDIDEGVGWIDNIIYENEKSMATFTLIPKR